LAGKRIAVAAALVALVGGFAALAVSVVEGRRPLDREVTQSFDTASKLAGRSAAVSALGCHKTRVDFYDCRAVVRPRRRLESMTLRYRLNLRDDRCWTAGNRTPNPPAGRFSLLQGCLAD
jgi:hypothetical protein